MDEPGRIRDIRAYRGSFVGMALLVCVPFLVLASTNLYGAAGAIVLLVVWLVLLVQGCRWFMPHPRRVALLGVLGLASWVVAVALVAV